MRARSRFLPLSDLCRAEAFDVAKDAGGAKTPRAMIERGLWLIALSCWPHRIAHRDAETNGKCAALDLGRRKALWVVSDSTPLRLVVWQMYP